MVYIKKSPQGDFFMYLTTNALQNTYKNTCIYTCLLQQTALYLQPQLAKTYCVTVWGDTQAANEGRL